jgi:hypothetical protein
VIFAAYEYDSHKEQTLQVLIEYQNAFGRRPKEIRIFVIGKESIPLPSAFRLLFPFQ